MRASLFAKTWPGDAFVATKTGKLESALIDAEVRMLVLPRKENGNNIRMLCSQTPGLQMILEGEQLKEETCAVLWGTLEVSFDGLESHQAGQ